MSNKVELKRQTILRTGEQLFASHRYDEITMEEVAKLAGVGKGTIYRYFSGKEALLHAVLQACHDDLAGTLRDLNSREGDFRTLLREFCEQITQACFRRHPMWHSQYTLCQRHGGQRDSSHQLQVDANRREISGEMTRFLDRGVREGCMRDDIPAEAQAHMLISMLNAWSHAKEHYPDYNVKLDTVLELFSKGAMK